MAQIIAFPGGRSTVQVSDDEFPETERQRASRRRNPLHRPYSFLAIAVTIAGKIHRGEPIEDIDEVAWLRRGAETARTLADELARIVEREAAR